MPSHKAAKSPLLYALCTSVVLHLCVAILFFIKPKPETQIQPLPSIEIMVVEAPAEKAPNPARHFKSKATQASKGRASPGQSALKKEGIGRLLPTYGFKPTDNSRPLPRAPEPPEHGETTSLNHIVNSTFESTLTLQPFYQGLSKKIYAHLDYPKPFIEMGVVGEVSLPLIVDEKGVFKGFQDSIRGSSKALKTYVLATCFAALKTPLPKKMWIKPGEYPLSLNIRFFIDSMRVQKSSIEVLGPIVDIHKVTYADGHINRRIEELYERYFPPIIPISGGFMIDFIRLYKMIEAWDDPDPKTMRQERFQMLVDALEENVRGVN